MTTTTPTTPGFDAALVALASWALVGAAAWAAVLVAAALVEAASGGRVLALARVGCPAPWRPALLWALGALLAAAGAAPAHAAARPEPLTGSDGTAGSSSRALLDVPARPFGAAPRVTASSDEVVVAPGDSLWRLARAHLAAGTTDAAVRAYVDRVHHANRAVIGPDPDVIRPGQLLRLPAPTREDPTP